MVIGEATEQQGGGMHVCTGRNRSVELTEQPVGVVCLLLHRSFRDGIQIVCLGGKCLYPLSHV